MVKTTAQKFIDRGCEKVKLGHLWRKNLDGSRTVFISARINANVSVETNLNPGTKSD